VDIRITCIVQFLNLANKIKGNFPKRTLVWAPTTQGSIQSAEARDSLSLLSGFKNSLALKEEKEKKGVLASILVTKLLSKGNASRPSSSQRVSPRLQSSPTSHRSKEHLADQLIRLSGNNPWFCFTKPDSANLPATTRSLKGTHKVEPFSQATRSSPLVVCLGHC